MDLSRFEPAVDALAGALRARGWKLASAESCTGGLLAAACTAVAGSSDWFERGVVSYSNDAKVALLGVPPELIADHGAVSEAVARAMAAGLLARAPVHLAVSVTGIAGPGGAVPGKPVGTVWLGWASAAGGGAELLQLQGDRAAVREQTVAAALARALAIAADGARAGTGGLAAVATAGDAAGSAPRDAAATVPDVATAAVPAVPGTSVAAPGRHAPSSPAAPLRVRLAGDIDADWRRELAAALPEADWIDDGDAEAAVVANPPPGSLAAMPSLRFVQSLWAGVDRLLGDATLPPDLPIARMVDPAMSAAMAETATWAVLSLHRGYFDYAAQQRDGVWRQRPQRRADEVAVLVLGRGAIGGAVAARLAQQGYRVATWHRGAALAPALAAAEIVVDLLPLTPQTRGLVDAAFLAQLRDGASFVNLGRGAHVVEADLLAALDAGRLDRAVLDVFATEPLPPGHRFWTHPRVTLLPHAAALTDPRSASAVAAANLRAWRDGRPVANLVDRARGY